MDSTALFKLGYGLYVLTARDGDKDNGCIINAVMQITSVPPFVSVASVNKQNYTHDMIFSTRQFNISTLTTETPFDVIKHFGFQSGAAVDKFADCETAARSENGLIYVPKYTNAYLSFEVTDTIDFGSHTIFKAEMTAGEILGKTESLTYSYYQQNIKPKPQPAHNTGYRCVICSYIFEGDVLPSDFICPICKHGVSDFVKL